MLCDKNVKSRQLSLDVENVEYIIRGNFGGCVSWSVLACARLSDSIRSGNLLKVKLRRARLGKGGSGGGKNGRESLLAFL